MKRSNTKLAGLFTMMTIHGTRLLLIMLSGLLALNTTLVFYPPESSAYHQLLLLGHGR
jgi:hypothetical protein